MPALARRAGRFRTWRQHRGTPGQHREAGAARIRDGPRSQLDRRFQTVARRRAGGEWLPTL